MDTNSNCRRACRRAWIPGAGDGDGSRMSALRLAPVGFPTMVLLVIPGLMHGQRLMDLSRKIQEEHSKGNFIVEQAVSFVRTVYSFAAEGRTMARFSAALDDSIKIGLKQGLSKGLAIGSNVVTFSIWVFMGFALVWKMAHDGAAVLKNAEGRDGGVGRGFGAGNEGENRDHAGEEVKSVHF